MVTECQDLFPEARNAPELHAINDRCQIRTQDGHRMVVVSGIVLTIPPFRGLSLMDGDAPG
jgi:hypothetical protein